MAKKQNKQMYWILGIVFLVILIYGGNHGWFKTTYNIGGDTINQLENPIDQGITCTLSLDKSVITSGDLITGTINDGVNSYCEGYGKMVGTADWRKISEGTTDINGRATYSENFFVEGDFIFAVICDSNGNGILDANDCVTNQVNLKVNPVVSSTCVDSDGGIEKGVPGHVTIGDDSIYDTCTSDNLGVIEYYCDDGILAGDTISCYPGSCVTTRSGGYCGESSSGGWDVGDVIYSESGESGISGGTITIKYIDLEDYGFIPGGNCHPEVKLHTYWDYQDAQACQGMTAAQAVKWSFYDSGRPAPRWTRTDITPPSNLEATIYPVSWDGTNPWHLDVGMVYQIPGCNVMYHWDLKIDIAECD